MSADCGRFKELLGPYADGELGPEQAAQVEEHVGRCAECRREIEAIRHLHLLVHKARPPQLTEDYWDWQRTRVWRRLREDRPERQRFYRPSFTWPKLATLAGGLVVVLVIATVGWQLLGPGLFQPKAALVTGTSKMPSAAQQAQDETKQAMAMERTAEKPPVRAASKEAGKSEAAEPARLDEVEADMKTEVATIEAAPPTTSAGSGLVVADKTEESQKQGVASKGFWKVEGAGKGKAGAARAGAPARPMPAPGQKQDEVEVARMVEPIPAEEKPTPLDVLSMPQVKASDTGTALVLITTDTTGTVLTVKLNRSSGLALLDSIALGAARKARFRPGTRAGRRAVWTFEYPFRFEAEKKAKD
jgi:TonB family protein